MFPRINYCHFNSLNLPLNYSRGSIFMSGSFFLTGKYCRATKFCALSKFHRIEEKYYSGRNFVAPKFSINCWTVVFVPLAALIGVVYRGPAAPVIGVRAPSWRSIRARRRRSVGSLSTPGLNRLSAAWVYSLSLTPPSMGRQASTHSQGLVAVCIRAAGGSRKPAQREDIPFRFGPRRRR